MALWQFLKLVILELLIEKILKEKTEKQPGEQLFFRSLLTKDLVNPLHFYVNRKITFVKSTRNFYS